MTKLRNALIVLVALVLSACGAANTPNPNPDPSVDFGNCTGLYAAVSSEKVNMFTRLGELFAESDEAKTLGKCVKIAPVDVASGEATRLLTSNWDITQTTKPRPALWSPASSIWVDQVKAIPDRTNLIGSSESFAWSPVVLAMPEPMARQMGWPNSPIGLKDINQICTDSKGWGRYGGAAATWGPFRLGKTNPTTSTTGLNMILMQAYAASGKAKGLGLKDVAKAEAFDRQIESCVIHYGDTTGNVLQRVYDRAAQGQPLGYVSAVAVEETSVVNYNLGNPQSRVVKAGETLVPPKEKMVAIYPSGGSLISDNPIVVLNADWVTPEQQAAAQEFAKFVQTPEAQGVLNDYGFRKLDVNAPLAGKFTPENGIDPTKKLTVLEKPDASVVTAVTTQWEQVRKPSSVLELIDVSGSMKETIPGTDQSKLKAAAQAASDTLSHFRSTDELGVWVFTTGLQNGPVGEVRPLSPLTGAREGLAEELKKLTPLNGTPLYDAVLSSYRYMQQKAQPGRINAIVVLSDGEDQDSTTSLDALLQELNRGTEATTDAPVRIFTIGFGSGARLDVLSRIAAASGGQAFDASDPRRIAEVFGKVIRNF